MAFDCSGGSGAGAAAFVVAGLSSAGYANVFEVPVSAAVCTEPVVVRQHEWAREARLDDGSERGLEHVRVYVCMCAADDAAATAAAVRMDLAAADWADVNASLDGLGVRLVSVDVGAATDLGRDFCGRWVRALDVACTVVRSDG